MRTTADIDQLQTTKTRVWSIFEIAARADRAAIAVARLGLIVVLLWIGGLKAFNMRVRASCLLLRTLRS
jgi:hypothetical protein